MTPEDSGICFFFLGPFVESGLGWEIIFYSDPTATLHLSVGCVGLNLLV